MKAGTFIKCSDKDTIKTLEKLGYKKVSEENGLATFLNDMSKPVVFTKGKVVYSNIMTT